MSFDLEKAIATWRRTLQHNRFFLEEDLEELECHLRDYIEAQVKTGITKKVAFATALRRLGSYGIIEQEYQKIRWAKIKHAQRCRQEIIAEATMLLNYIKIGLRNLRQHKVNAFINIFGLAVGMACCFLIFLLVYFEWSYDSFHENGDSIYRTYVEFIRPDGSIDNWLLMPPRMAPALEAEFPGILRVNRVVAGNQDFQIGDEFFRQRLMEADSTFFEMFSFPLLTGDPATALDDPGSMVITETLAAKFFGVQAAQYGEALGRTVSITPNEIRYDFTVTGVVKELPPNSSLQFDAMIPFVNYGNIYLGSNDSGGRTSTYVQLHMDQNEVALEEALPPFVNSEFANVIQDWQLGDILAEGAGTFSMLLQPLRELHLDPNLWVPYEETPHNPRYSFILTGIGLLVLLIACINFMILSVGRSAGRAREVGVRKVLGAYRGQLMKQFWCEALILSIIALLLGIFIAVLALPAFNNLTGQTLSLTGFNLRSMIPTLAVLMAVVGLVAGGYPAAVLSRFHPASVLKGDIRTKGRNSFTRALVVAQYTISIALIVSTIIMARQLHFLMNKDLGYDQDQVIVVHTNQVGRTEASNVVERFRNDLLPNDRITHVVRTGYSFTRGGDRNTWTDENGVMRGAYNFGVDYNYIDMMDMEIVAGRNFSRDFPIDPTHSLLVNEALVREFDIEDPINYTMTGWLSWIYDEPPTVIGVVKDFHFLSLHNEVRPAVMNMHPDYYMGMGAILIKVKPDHLPDTIQRVEEEWKAVMPGKPFTYSFLDEDIAGQYQTERRWSRIVTYSSLFAVLIACLGLFGLATLSVSKRTKEIGIRKALGASVSGILLLISTEFVKLVMIAAVLAWPFAYFGMTQWLENFAFRVDISWWIFIVAGLAALLVALLAVGYQSIRAAVANPVDSLRYE